MLKQNSIDQKPHQDLWELRLDDVVVFIVSDLRQAEWPQWEKKITSACKHAKRGDIKAKWGSFEFAWKRKMKAYHQEIEWELEQNQLEQNKNY